MLFRSPTSYDSGQSVSCGVKRPHRAQPPIGILDYEIFNPDRYFLSITTGRVHHISLPQLVGKKILDATNGWMLLYDVLTQALSLHNPVSLAYIHLPSTEFVLGVGRGRLFYDRFVDDYVVVFEICESKRMWFCKVRDESWSALKHNFYVPCYRIIYHKGKFFTVDYGFIYAIDIIVASSGQWISVGSSDLSEDISPEYVEIHYFFVTLNGELLLVFDFVGDADNHRILSHKFDYESQQFTQSKVQFEDYAIFTFIGQPFTCCVKDFPQYKKNCAYSYEVLRMPPLRRVVGITDCEDGRRDYIRCEWEIPDDFEEEPLWITLSFQQKHENL